MPKEDKTQTFSEIPVDSSETTVQIIKYNEYKDERGELSQDQYQTIIDSNPSQDKILLMTLYLRKAFSIQQLGHLVDRSDGEVAAKINDGLKDKVPRIGEDSDLLNWNWLLTEAYLLQGKNPDEIITEKFPNLNISSLISR